MTVVWIVAFIVGVTGGVIGKRFGLHPELTFSLIALAITILGIIPLYRRKPPSDPKSMDHDRPDYRT